MQKTTVVQHVLDKDLQNILSQRLMETETFLQLSSKTVTSKISDKENTSRIDLLFALNNENTGVCYNLYHGKDGGKGRAFLV